MTDEMVEDAERLLGISLPASLLTLLRVQNGGGVAERWNVFPTPVPTSWNDNHVPFGDLLGVGRRERMTSLLDAPYLVEEWDLPAPIVLLSGDGHCWVALDYRACGRQGDPSVTWFDTDAESDLVLAPDFESFVEGLTSTDGLASSVQPV
ncbi:SMI1/KNR4 family protein [Streptomyces sp. NPDC058274]|uniref:SMI1/KNR4 family protein n=1 Tax=Streptomyces sp. NPDC058274 TaxID=3346416 RepID=UPI0036E810F5